MNIAANLKKLKDELGQGVNLVAVSKYSTIQEIREAYDAGHRDFGENKVQDLEDKRHQLPSDIHWHFIGHLQRNKVKYIADYIHLIHGVDSFKLLREIDKQAVKIDKVVNCLLQVHIAEEETKFGLDINEVEEIMADSAFADLANVKVLGLMGMATNTTNQTVVKKEFTRLAELFSKLKSQALPANASMEILSMGMSQDYALALQAGTTMVRIGTAVFKS